VRMKFAPQVILTCINNTLNKDISAQSPSPPHLTHYTQTVKSSQSNKRRIRLTTYSSYPCSNFNIVVVLFCFQVSTMKTLTVLPICGVIIIIARGVFPKSFTNQENMNCKPDDQLKYGSCKSRIQYSLLESQLPHSIIKLYNRSRRFPNVDYLLYIEGDICVQLSEFGVHFVHM